MSLKPLPESKDYGNRENRPFYETVCAADSFLSQRGFLSGNPTLDYENVAALQNGIGGTKTWPQAT
ncbi:hypothetical protein KFU94_26815 [Chloroflexi bacterium TSY]|nr:hypothetical protein [Chloroflexi bacterium TSY]